MEYITQKDARKRDAIEMNGEPAILWAARTKRGDKNYADLALKLSYEAGDIACAKNGLPKEMTMERRWGNHIKHDGMITREFHEDEYEL